MKRVRGQALTEFALVIPVLLLVLLGLFDVGRALYAYNTLGNASRAGMRTAIVDQNPSVIEAKALAASIGISPGSISVDFTPCDDPEIGCLATVKVTNDWSAITPIIGNIVGPIDLSSESTMPIERVYTSSP